LRLVGEQIDLMEATFTRRELQKVYRRRDVAAVLSQVQTE
jgi:hypothetical protein